MTIIPHNFGKEERERARSFARLLKIVEDHEADILAHPAKYIDMASQKLAENELFIQRLWEALRLPWAMNTASPWIDGTRVPDQLQPDIVRIDRRDYEAFQAVKALINSRRS